MFCIDNLNGTFTKIEDGIIIDGAQRPARWVNALSIAERKRLNIKPIFYISEDLEKGEKYDGEKVQILSDKIVIERIKVSADIELVRNKKISELSMACENEIVSGFDSKALGASHKYQSDRDDQSNLIGVAVAGNGGLFKCSEDGGVTWEYKDHTHEQIMQVIQDGKEMKLSALAKFGRLKALAKSAATVQELKAISWND